jgi:hypothetical protein
MKTSIPLALLVAVSTGFAACTMKESAEEGIASATSDEASYAPTEKVVQQRKFVRTADWKFKVKDVKTASNFVEDITQSMGGFVTHMEQNSVVSEKSKVAISADSTLESTFYQMENFITIRVPSNKLDTTLRAIAAFVEYQDSKTVKAEDVSFSMLSNRLTQERATESGKRLKVDVDMNRQKLNQTLEGENVISKKDEEADMAMVSNLSMMDQVNYSTVHMQMYQNPTVHREVICNFKDIRAYEPGFFTRLWESVTIGWDFIETLVIFLARAWVLFVIAAIGWWWYAKRFKAAIPS